MPACSHPEQLPLTVCAHCQMVVPPIAEAKPRRRSRATRSTAKQSVLGAAKKVVSEEVAVEDWQPVTVRVHGTPVTQGSMRAVARGVLIHEKSKELKAWRELIAKAMVEAGAQPVGKQVPVRLDVVFWLPRPKSITPEKRPLPSAKSADLDKAIRAVGDGIDGVIIADDSQITTVVAQKRYADEENPPGAWIRVTLDGEEPAGRGPSGAAS